MEFSLYGLLEWALLNAKKTEAAQNVSNILIFLYAISYIINRKAVFITAFLLVELYGGLRLFDDLNNYQYYLVYSVCYVICYWIVYSQTKSVKICLGYVILILFELAMVYSEWKWPKVETIIYTYYEYIVMVVHIYIISAITNGAKLKLFCGHVASCIRTKFSASYSLSFIWYTLHKTYIKK